MEVRFSTSKALWLDMVFVVGNQGRIVEASDAQWNCGELLDWLTGIVRGDDTVIMNVDREGEIDAVVAHKIDEDRIHLLIQNDLNDDDGGAPYINAVVSRRKLVWEVYAELAKTNLSGSSQGWWRLPEVEAWLNWETCNNTLEITDPVFGRTRI